MKTSEKLALLRAEMKKRGISAYVVVTDDFHASEYVGTHFKAREFLSGFTGSAGTLVVLPDSAALWTDGRYFLQASQQLAGSGIELMRMGEPGVPEIADFLRDHVEENGFIGFDSRTVSNAFARTIGEKTREKHIRFAGGEDLVDLVWADRPALSCEPVWTLDVKYTGLTRREKLAMVRGKMEELGADVFVIPALDEVAWLLNLRGGDVLYTPVFLSYLLLGRDQATLCVQKEAVSAEIEAQLKADGVSLAPYDDIYRLIAALPTATRVLLDGERANYRITQSVPDGAETLDRPSPIQLMKAMKTPAEQENERLAHIKDGVAVTRFLYWLKHAVGKEPITELSAAKKLESLRAEGEHYLEQSFDPILAYGAHGAIVHYEPTEETDISLEPHGLCLADTGAQYLEGTTDITRTVALGPLTDEEKRIYTLVLRGHLQLGAAKFLYGCTGENLDMLARTPLWENGLDYNHGTGHGVGFVLGVHEGPERVHWDVNRQKRHCVIEEGMIFSNEPGIYLAGKFGVRIENLVVVREADPTEFGRFLKLEPLTLVPYDRDAIDLTMLSSRDVELLNDYHAKVCAAISPYLQGDELNWLKEVTAPVALG
mgnify:FL=1